ncbi:hypothetical protein [Shewanella pealeana]|uniref:Uncharacterized protein n=1 Tax=Shewanella pealeana (strain ATCC 700345 / ANG-SQ1) TaxID=398579 RepID=A8GZT1_SHEPA|nr:hypothetical protein [Shewanella pealeana]ABV85818.1 hypothetical protein Spea_0490 [Shewanella pealeana ATCC 700345]
MSGIIWTLETLKTIEQLDYLWRVIENSDLNEQDSVYFGIKGEGHSPNYLIKNINGEKKAYKGLSHTLDPEGDYNPNNLSQQGFSQEELKSVFDQQSKSPNAAKALMLEYWKANKERFPPNLEVGKYRSKIIELSTKGIPIARSFDLAISNPD